MPPSSVMPTHVGSQSAVSAVGSPRTFPFTPPSVPKSWSNVQPPGAELRTLTVSDCRSVASDSRVAEARGGARSLTLSISVLRALSGETRLTRVMSTTISIPRSSDSDVAARSAPAGASSLYRSSE